MNPAYESPALRNYTPSASFISENATHGDMICTPVPENAGRLKGPSLGVLAWFDHVLAVRPRARYIAMADDDAYLHIPELVSILRGIPNRTYAYIGAIMGWSFHDEDYLFRAFGWSGCANCTGPFPFAVGSFMAVSAPLAAALAAGTRLPQLAAANRTELERVYALSPRHHTFYQACHPVPPPPCVPPPLCVSPRAAAALHVTPCRRPACHPVPPPCVPSRAHARMRSSAAPSPGWVPRTT
jgi:hypothetical protein